MREAIYDALCNITDFDDRVGQAFTMPSGTPTPYCTFKFTSTLRSIDNKLGSILGLEVYIYNAPSSFVSLDGLVKKVIAELDGVALTTDDGNVFTPEYENTLPDIYDDTEDKFVKRVEFKIPQHRP
jgi:hypothetical protein